MSKFQYVASDSRGHETRGIIEAIDLNRAVGRIREMKLFPTKVVEDKGLRRDASSSRRDPRGKAGALNFQINIPGLSGRVGSKVLTHFTRQLATLVQAGLPLLRGLRAIQDQESNANLRHVIADLITSIEEGSTFSDALALHPRVFNRLFINMVKAGEVGGVLEVVLRRLSDFMDKAQKIKGKVVAAMFYPCAVIVVATGIMALLMLYVIPKFKEVFTGSLVGNRPLPAFTQLVLAISDAIRDHILFAALAAVAGFILFRLIVRTGTGRRLFDQFKLKMPIVGPVISKVAISRFTRTLGTLVSSGVPILQALTIVKETAGNVIIAKAVADVHESVKEGETITAPLGASRVFPSTVISMVDVGEQTGALPEMLMKIAVSYDEEVDNAVTSMTSLLEPIMIVFLAVIVGSIVIAMFLPLLDIINHGVDGPGADSADSELKG